MNEIFSIFNPDWWMDDASGYEYGCIGLRI